jgi:hypothetical protein
MHYEHEPMRTLLSFSSLLLLLSLFLLFPAFASLVFLEECLLLGLLLGQLLKRTLAQRLARGVVRRQSLSFPHRKSDC